MQKHLTVWSKWAGNSVALSAYLSSAGGGWCLTNKVRCPLRFFFLSHAPYIANITVSGFPSAVYVHFHLLTLGTISGEPRFRIVLASAMKVDEFTLGSTFFA